MRAILISIKPEWVAKILNGEKTIEIRKTMPKCDLPIDVYIYCTKDNKQGLVWDNRGKGLVNSLLFPYGKDCPERYRLVNGKVVAKFTLYQVERFDVPYPAYFSQVEKGLKHITDNSCLTLMELHHYLKDKTGYALYIDNLEIFDRPKELSEFKRYGGLEYAMKNADNPLVDDNWHEIVYLTKAPQSWCYVEVE